MKQFVKEVLKSTSVVMCLSPMVAMVPTVAQAGDVHIHMNGARTVVPTAPAIRSTVNLTNDPITCGTGNSCTVSIPANSIVSWSLVSQAAKTQGLTIYDGSTKLVDTSVYSLNMSNQSVGNIRTTSSASYTVTFSSATGIRYDIGKVGENFSLDAITFLFAIEDGTDGDYNDAFVTITAYAKSG